jgi:hypothetical protein
MRRSGGVLIAVGIVLFSVGVALFSVGFAGFLLASLGFTVAVLLIIYLGLGFMVAGSCLLVVGSPEARPRRLRPYAWLVYAVLAAVAQLFMATSECNPGTGCWTMPPLFFYASAFFVFLFVFDLLWGRFVVRRPKEDAAKLPEPRSDE